MGLNSLYPKRELDSFSRFCRAQSRDKFCTAASRKMNQNEIYQDPSSFNADKNIYIRIFYEKITRNKKNVDGAFADVY